jgi:hypothetical protein
MEGSQFAPPRLAEPDGAGYQDAAIESRERIMSLGAVAVIGVFFVVICVMNFITSRRID